ncbi:uncharacterized protein PV09_00358 [Verruconis gallopava]|uniref:Uncharacterized protein n=1 Tax=Verruconis gallopava TaxID=253628 RepID=A0A0D2BDI6_9PEZI|nr:uncharacterized protein PV09_00358 [Verruconis gallopava]KIW09479.1 hypothetical protein PV09_00358 [Verruconis gallopava]
MSLSSTTPHPQSWTIRLKHHRTTVLLHVEPLLLLSTLKEELLAVLKEVSPNGFNGHQLPSSASEISFAKPVDPLDISQGWEPLEFSDDPEDPFNIDNEESKRKTKKLESESLKAYGIKDNAVLAFRFKSEKGTSWDVEQAVHMDEFGVENEGDMGMMKEYRG